MIAQERLGPGRIHHCMRWIGICERAFDMMCSAPRRASSAPGKPLGTRQIVQAWIAESRAEIDAARLMVLHAAWTIEHEGASDGARGDLADQVLRRRTCCSGCSTARSRCTARSASPSDTPLAYWYAHERGARIYDGPDEVHKMVVAKRILQPLR